MEVVMDKQAQDVQYLVGSEGIPTAVLIDISLWEQILDALEEVEDIQIAKHALASIDAVGGDLEKAGFLTWASARAELGRMDGTKK
jgi:hypothetical protein